MDFAADPGECAQLPPRDDNVQVSHELSLERPLGTNKDRSALGEALYWMAEKLTWGYEDVETDPAEAFRRLTTQHRKKIFDIYAAMPSSWNTPRIADRTAS